MARESRASLQQQIDATKTQAQRRDEAEERASLAEASLKRAGEKQAEAERALAQAVQVSEEWGRTAVGTCRGASPPTRGGRGPQRWPGPLATPRAPSS